MPAAQPKPLSPQENSASSETAASTPATTPGYFPVQTLLQGPIEGGDYTTGSLGELSPYSKHSTTPEDQDFTEPKHETETMSFKPETVEPVSEGYAKPSVTNPPLSSAIKPVMPVYYYVCDPDDLLDNLEEEPKTPESSAKEALAPISEHNVRIPRHKISSGNGVLASDERRREQAYPGLPNPYGNFCFINSAIQYLKATLSPQDKQTLITSWLEKEKEEPEDAQEGFCPIQLSYYESGASTGAGQRPCPKKVQSRISYIIRIALAL